MHNNAVSIRTIDMAQGQKKVRFAAWTFFDQAGQQQWRRQRWAGKTITP
jgi:23S rRNA (adenine1618-N6)-methyltransferase